MTVSQQQLFLDLSELSEEQIEVGLEAGVWGEPVRPIVQRHLDQMRLDRVESAAERQLDTARKAIDVALKARDEASACNLRATIALIVATGAMMAAMASACVAFLAL
jgi:hypothetical protein